MPTAAEGMRCSCWFEYLPHLKHVEIQVHAIDPQVVDQYKTTSVSGGESSVNANPNNEEGSTSRKRSSLRASGGESSVNVNPMNDEGNTSRRRRSLRIKLNAKNKGRSISRKRCKIPIDVPYKRARKQPDRSTVPKERRFGYWIHLRLLRYIVQTYRDRLSNGCCLGKLVAEDMVNLQWSCKDKLLSFSLSPDPFIRLNLVHGRMDRLRHILHFFNPACYLAWKKPHDTLRGRVASQQLVYSIWRGVIHIMMHDLMKASGNGLDFASGDDDDGTFAHVYEKISHVLDLLHRVDRSRGTKDREFDLFTLLLSKDRFAKAQEHFKNLRRFTLTNKHLCSQLPFHEHSDRRHGLFNGYLGIYSLMSVWNGTMRRVANEAAFNAPDTTGADWIDATLTPPFDFHMKSETQYDPVWHDMTNNQPTPKFEVQLPTSDEIVKCEEYLQKLDIAFASITPASDLASFEFFTYYLNLIAAHFAVVPIEKQRAAVMETYESYVDSNNGKKYDSLLLEVCSLPYVNETRIIPNDGKERKMGIIPDVLRAPDRFPHSAELVVRYAKLQLAELARIAEQDETTRAAGAEPVFTAAIQRLTDCLAFSQNIASYSLWRCFAKCLWFGFLCDLKIEALLGALVEPWWEECVFGDFGPCGSLSEHSNSGSLGTNREIFRWQQIVQSFLV